MILLDYDSFVNESLSMNDNSEFLNSILDQDLKTVEVSLKYATKTQRLFNDGFKRLGKETHSNVFTFKSSDDLYAFMEVLVNEMEIESDEFELS